MSFDERMTRMAERSRAVMESLELTAAITRKNRESIERLADAIDQDTRNIRALMRIAEGGRPI